MLKGKTLFFFKCNLKNFFCRKINSLSDHKPTGGNVKIFHDKPKFNVTSKIGSLENAKHVPGQLILFILY